ncbi:PhoPQ-activated pathogenicity-related family protein [Dyadobacter psychrotolerans]|uniref:PhoPQ-activated pathogenicity-like protein PqaA type n=1 Tax=Dyadobacter psychrotolerans TaxID=2541721 RepID=A0A4R5DPA5_9BACT|nr:PhoPQ-activated protein PqaA family protein [Dyadobacter psychrotolerans]TDE12775.1 PhoPQ-activated pathogenicity-like protein PqaA type [Dyadobacter psychrotolerans]
MFKKITILVSSFFLLQSFTFNVNAQKTITPETALQSYLDNGDKTFKWELKDSYTKDDLTIYNILLTSQKWREFTWTHQLTIIVPKENKHDGALLFITGGSNKNELPNWNSKKDDKLIASLSGVAAANKAIVVQLKQTPNQPFFGDLTEDALISYTLHNFKKDKDYSWPLLFPMVKSAVRAMDVVQEFSKQKLNHEVKRFVVSGASKRGWTTWLTGASDKRVAAIAPMVIDILNMPVSLDYQIKSWGDYSIQIEDYVKLGIPQNSNTPDGSAITTMIDPYSYRAKLTMPKMIFMGTNDEYWVVDNIKNYLKDIPGDNSLHYVPNAGHDLGGGAQAMEALGAFYGATLNKTPYTVCDWKQTVTKKGVQVDIRATANQLVDVILWSVDSPDQDIRNDKWTSKSLGIKNKSKVEVTEAFPSSGFRAFYVDLKYKNSTGGTFTESTRVFLTNEKAVL